MRFDVSKPFIYFAADSDWAGCPFTRYSRCAYLVMMLGAPTSWCSRLAKRTARSGCEAEYYSVAESVSEMIFTRDMLIDLGVQPPLPFTLFDDCLSVEALTRNEMRPSLARHIEIDYQFAQDEYAAGLFQFFFIPGTDNVADVFTKFKGYTADSYARFVDIILRGRDQQS